MKRILEFLLANVPCAIYYVCNAQIIQKLFIEGDVFPTNIKQPLKFIYSYKFKKPKENYEKLSTGITSEHTDEK